MAIVVILHAPLSAGTGSLLRPVMPGSSKNRRVLRKHRGRVLQGEPQRRRRRRDRVPHPFRDHRALRRLPAATRPPTVPPAASDGGGSRVYR